MINNSKGGDLLITTLWERLIDKCRSFNEITTDYTKDERKRWIRDNFEYFTEEWNAISKHLYGEEMFRPSYKISPTRPSTFPKVGKSPTEYK